MKKLYIFLGIVAFLISYNVFFSVQYCVVKNSSASEMINFIRRHGKIISVQIEGEYVLIKYL